jgi:hypothetical protein
MIAMRIAAACGLGLELVHECLGGTLLPLAGSYFAQLGLMLGATFNIVELIETLREGRLRLPRWRKRQAKLLDDDSSKG